MPLAAHGDTAGMLNIEGPDGGLEMIAASVYIELIAENLGLAIAHLQPRDRLANLAVKHPLTGLLNRRSLDENLNRLRREATDLPAALMMIDIYDFKPRRGRFRYEPGGSDHDGRGWKSWGSASVRWRRVRDRDARHRPERGEVARGATARRNRESAYHPLGSAARHRDGFDRRCVNTRRATVNKPDAEAGVPSSSEGWWAQRRHHRLGYRRCRAVRRLGCYVR
ncbi:diguanylate cyclase (plasmid) [Rhizobium leguminosarum]|nr:diguanylate cyclase [Rhizobium leguminosarum]